MKKQLSLQHQLCVKWELWATAPGPVDSDRITHGSKARSHVQQPPFPNKQQKEEVNMCVTGKDKSRTTPFPKTNNICVT